MSDGPGEISRRDKKVNSLMKRWIVIALASSWLLSWLVWIPVNAMIRARTSSSLGGESIIPGELSVAAWPWVPGVYYVTPGAVVLLIMIGVVIGMRLSNQKDRWD